MVDAESERIAREAESALERIIGSAPFQRSARLRAFLRYIAEARLDGREELKEYEVGVQVFDRPEHYDPQSDPIVRVQARQLRFKLREYYETAGAAERLRIELPKGSYLPVFHRIAEPEASIEAKPEVPGPPIVLPLKNRSRTRMSRIWVPLTVFGALAVMFGLNRWSASTRAAQHVPDREAQDLCAKGRYYWNKRNPEALNTAVDYFIQAIVRDPDYARAYVGLADSYNLMREFSAMPADEAFNRATAAAKRAVALDDGSAEAHASLGFCLFWGAWEREAGLREFKRAIALDPSYATAHHWYATALFTGGRVNEASVEIQRARDLDSGSAAIASDQGLILFAANEPDRAMALLKQLEASDPAFMSPHTYLSKVYFAQGDYRNFIVESERTAQLAQDQAALSIAAAAKKGFAESGYRGMLECMLTVQEKLYREGKKPAYLIARTAALLGKRSEALTYLHASLSRREMLLLDAESDPAFASLRADGAWTRLLTSISGESK